MIFERNAKATNLKRKQNHIEQDKNQTNKRKIE